VVVPPPGYDPTNPNAFRAQQARRPAGPPPRRDGGPGGRDGGPPMGRDGGRDMRPDLRPGAQNPSYPPAQGGGPAAGAAGGAASRRRVAESQPQPTYVSDAAPERGRRSREAAHAMEQAMRVRPRRRKKAMAPGKSLSPQPKAQKRKIRIDGAVSVAQLAHEMSIKAPMLIKKLMEFGTLATVNEMLDFETATLIANEFDYEIENVGFDESEYLQHVSDDVELERKAQRPPVVTVMGHVDHGKTTLLDAIRMTKVAAGEAGGITQHIGAYQVERNGRLMTFLDTPGHAAFSSMRARGAGVTDVVVLVVAADDGVQPQTAEAIHHARAAGVPIVVAINKIDKPGVNPDSIKQRLGEYDLVPEEWGGETLFAEVSALKGIGIDDLLESILLQADVLDLQANAERHAEGAVIEAKLERGRGAVATVLVQQGTMRLGDHVVLGSAFGKVRAMMDFLGKPIKEAGPSMPVEIFGLSDLPNVGDSLAVVANEKNARTLAEHRAQAERQSQMSTTRRRTVDDLRRLAGQEEVKTLFVVLKADVSGSLEALKGAVAQLRADGCEVRILHDGVGAISESDVNLVASNDGLLIGFNVKVDSRARKVADELGVKPETYDVIYDVLDRVNGALRGMLDPVYEENRLGTVEVRALFNISKVGTVAGCYVLDGKISRSSTARVMREGKELWKGDVSTLKRFKDDVREVSAGYECGVALQGAPPLQVGDILETYVTVRVEPTSSSSRDS
jgi:translation initiation factor IF-2